MGGGWWGACGVRWYVCGERLRERDRLTERERERERDSFRYGLWGGYD